MVIMRLRQAAIHWNLCIRRQCTLGKSILVTSNKLLNPLCGRIGFQTLVGLAVLSIIFLYARNQILVHRRHQQKLIQSELETIELERSRIAKDLHDSVGNDLSAIK
jgi:signal transduction histidine kinase